MPKFKVGESVGSHQEPIPAFHGWQSFIVENCWEVVW